MAIVNQSLSAGEENADMPAPEAYGANDMDELLQQMIEARQFSEVDAAELRRQCAQNEAGPIGDETDALRWLAAEYALPFTTLEGVDPDAKLLSRFPARVLLQHGILPLERVNGTVQVAVSRLFATEGLDTLKTMTGMTLSPVLAPHETIQREIKKRLGVGADTLDTLARQEGGAGFGGEETLQVVDEDQDDNVDLDQAAGDASIIRFVNQVLADAITLRSTDVHLEPFENELRIRYRIDGVLQEVPVPPQLSHYQPAIVSRIKILSHLDIAEKRLPQDGRIKIRVAKSEVDVRVSIIPMLHGEAVVLRLLRQDAALRGMVELKLGAGEQRLFQAVLGLPHGIMLVTGPTGSGKTTTLYAALSEINDLTRKIITIEDPIEYQLHGVNQIQVSPKAGLTFARGLRSILRHDPDVLLIGEIRDGETAQIAVQASLTGHLVFSTLHTNDAPGALTRLVDMGVEPFLVASSLEAVLAQRLVRVLCEKCKTVDDSPAALAFKEGIGIPASQPVYRAVGCEACRRTGFHGRRGLFEVMEVNEQVRQLILKSRLTNEIREVARKSGLRSLSEDGWRVVGEGATTVEEVLRVTKDERIDQSILANGH